MRYHACDSFHSQRNRKEHPDVKHINLDTEDERVKQFVLSLELDADGSVLEADGKPVAHVLPVAENGESYDCEKLKAAILARRDESRSLNVEWEHTDRDIWEHE
jgi:hypothetical protein